MITNGTTPTIYLTFDLDWDNVTDMTVTFKQNVTRLQLEKDRFTYSDGKISAVLSQKETLALRKNRQCEVQIKAKTIDDKVYASNIVQVGISEILDEVIM